MIILEAPTGVAEWSIRADPRVKIILLSILIVCALSSWKILTLLTYLSISLLFFLASRLKLRHMLHLYEESTLFLALFTLGLALSSGGQVIHIWIIPISLTGLLLGVKVMLKLYSILTFVIYTFYTCYLPDFITALRKLGVPHKIALTLIIAFRYVQEVHDKLMFMLKYARLRGYRPVLSVETLRAAGLIVTNLLIRYSQRSTMLSNIVKLRTLGDVPDVKTYMRSYVVIEPVHVVTSMFIIGVLILDKVGVIPWIAPT